jgi:hypothetical protein
LSLLAGQLLPATNHAQQTADSPTLLRLKLVGANLKAGIAALDELPGRSNYFLGNDPKKWRTNVPNYAKVKYQSVYPGVDLVYYGNQRQLEYDFVVAPGADPRAIALEIVGPGLAPATGTPVNRRTALQINPNGDLVIKTQGGEVHFHKPVVYQEPSTVGSPRCPAIQNPKSKIANRLTAATSSWPTTAWAFKWALMTRPSLWSSTPN